MYVEFGLGFVLYGKWDYNKWNFEIFALFAVFRHSKLSNEFLSEVLTNYEHQVFLKNILHIFY